MSPSYRAEAGDRENYKTSDVVTPVSDPRIVRRERGQQCLHGRHRRNPYEETNERRNIQRSLSDSVDILTSTKIHPSALKEWPLTIAGEWAAVTGHRVNPTNHAFCQRLGTAILQGFD